MNTPEMERTRGLLSGAALALAYAGWTREQIVNLVDEALDTVLAEVLAERVAHEDKGLE